MGGSAPSVAEGGAVHVLLVEDNSQDAALLRRMLSRAKGAQFELVSVGTLSDAVRQARESWADVALLDLSLPDARGLTAVTRIRTAAPRLPVVVLTGLADLELARDAFRAGVKDYVVKDDLTASVLLRIIRHAIERQALENSLRQHNADLRALLDAVPDAVFRLGEKGDVELLNPDSPLNLSLHGVRHLEELVPRDMAESIHARVKEGVPEGRRVSCFSSSVPSDKQRTEAHLARCGPSTILVLRREGLRVLKSTPKVSS